MERGDPGRLGPGPGSRRAPGGPSPPPWSRPRLPAAPRPSGKHFRPLPAAPPPRRPRKPLRADGLLCPALPSCRRAASAVSSRPRLGLGLWRGAAGRRARQVGAGVRGGLARGTAVLAGDPCSGGPRAPSPALVLARGRLVDRAPRFTATRPPTGSEVCAPAGKRDVAPSETWPRSCRLVWRVVLHARGS